MKLQLVSYLTCIGLSLWLVGCGPDAPTAQKGAESATQQPAAVLGSSPTATRRPTVGPSYDQVKEVLMKGLGSTRLLDTRVEGWQGWVAESWKAQNGTYSASLYMSNPYTDTQTALPEWLDPRKRKPSLLDPDLIAYSIGADQIASLGSGNKVLISGTIGKDADDPRLPVLLDATVESIDQSQLLPTRQDISSAVITFERTMCLGTCPAYKLTIYGDGRVAYEGKYHVKTQGTQSSTISEELVARLISEFDRVGFFSLERDYSREFTDNPSAITTITIDGKTMQVTHDFSSTKVPRRLYILENKIDETANSEQWVR